MLSHRAGEIGGCVRDSRDYTSTLKMMFGRARRDKAPKHALPSRQLKLGCGQD
jgi:hypothetical protein